MKTCLTMLLLWAALSAHAIRITSFDYVDWRTEGLSCTFDQVDFFAEGLSEDFDTRYAVAAGGGDSSPITVNFGVSFTEENGPREVDLFYTFDIFTGALAAQFVFIPDGWSVEPTFTYDPETFSGSLSWAFSGADIPPVPDTSGGLVLFGAGVVTLAGFRRYFGS